MAEHSQSLLFHFLSSKLPNKVERNSENDFIKHTNSVLFAADMNCILFAETWVAVRISLTEAPLLYTVQSKNKTHLSHSGL